MLSMCALSTCLLSTVLQIDGSSGWEEGAGPFGRIDEAMRSFQHGAQLFGAFPEDVASMFRDFHRDMGSLLGGFSGVMLAHHAPGLPSAAAGPAAAQLGSCAGDDDWCLPCPHQVRVWCLS